MRQITLRRVVVTGMGAVSPNGNDCASYCEANRRGISGVRRIEEFDTSRLESRVAGMVQGLDLQRAMEARQLARVSRLVPLAVIAAREALGQAKLEPEALDLPLRRQIGVTLGTGGGGIEFVERQYGYFYFDQLNQASVFTAPAGTHGNLSSEISIALGLRGPSHVVSTGCTSSTDALGHAFRRVQYGETPLMLAGGADAPVAPGVIMAFDFMKIIAKHWNDQPERASRPFNKDRDGFVLAEGAWMLVLEEREHALRRGAAILGELLGYASTCDAWHRVSLHVDLEEPLRALELAIQDAGAAKDEIDYVNLHGTATELNDRVETAILKRCFGPRARRIPMSTTKSMIGHPQGACGAAGVVASLLAARAGFLPPTINYDVPDPECDLDYIPNQARPARVETLLCNAMGFGSKNSALVVRVCNGA